MSTRTRAAARWAARLVLMCLLGVVLFSAAVLTVVPRAVDGVDLTVLTGSMNPAIPQGSIVIDRPVDTSTLHVGDIATYQVSPGKNDYVTHRIVKIDSSKSPAEFTFKGDANRGPDMKLVPATAIRGKVWFHVPYLGTIRDGLHTKGGLAGVGIVLLGGYALYQLTDAMKDRWSARGKAPSAFCTSLDAPSESADDLDVATIRQRLAALLAIDQRDFENLEPMAVFHLLGAALLASGPDFDAQIAKVAKPSTATTTQTRRPNGLRIWHRDRQKAETEADQWSGDTGAAAPEASEPSEVRKERAGV